MLFLMHCADCVLQGPHQGPATLFTSEEQEKQEEQEAVRAPNRSFGGVFTDAKDSDDEDYEGLSNSHGHEDEEYRRVVNPVTETTSI